MITCYNRSVRSFTLAPEYILNPDKVEYIHVEYMKDIDKRERWGKGLNVEMASSVYEMI
jgi:hypothetical protein